MQTTASELKINRILVPIDFSAPADEAFQHAVKLAEGFDARVDVVHVWTRAPEPSGAMIGEVGTQPPPVMNSITEKTARQGLERFLQDRQAFSNRIGESLLVEGNPARVIVDTAKELNSDMIAMGTQGRTG
ncbi:MAG: universal stress protein, partial [Myxococcota bacterium]